MAVRTKVSVAKMLKASREWYYERNGSYYFVSKDGAVAVMTKDLYVLEELQVKGAVLIVKDGLKQIFDLAIQKIQQQDTLSLVRTDITFLYDYHASEKKKPVAVYRDADGKQMKIVATEYVDIFDPQLIESGTSYRDPIVFVCKDCYGLVMPIRVKERFVKQLKADTEKLLFLFETAVN